MPSSAAAPGESSWTIADGQFWFWVATMGLVISIVACFQLAPAAIMRDGRRIAQVAVGLVVAVPSSVAAVYVMRPFVTYGGETTDALVATIQDQSLGNALLRMFGYRVVADVAVPTDDGAIARAMTTAKLAPNAVIGQYTVVFLILAIMVLAALFLYVSMSIRSFSLVALAATAPIGLMMIGQPKFAVWAWSFLLELWLFGRSCRSTPCSPCRAFRRSCAASAARSSFASSTDRARTAEVFCTS
ncbi:hypothetical protein [Plantibacter sp. RU18]|uniref:hypothetical protein n=1 Tax=Plantibacter sp. RU18 TaxID=3158143 RepID=UPI003D35D5F7